MIEDKTLHLSLIIAVIGLTILAFMPSSEYIEKTIEELERECEGKINVKGEISNSFFSEKGNHIGLMSKGDIEILIMLPEDGFFTGKRIEVKGRASRYREKCFVFSEDIEKESS